MAIRTKTQIITEAIDFIKSKFTNIATEIGSVVRDLVIEAPAEEFERLNEELERTQQIQSFNFPEEMTEDELDALSANYGLVRKQGTASTGTITFQIRNFSTSSSPITVPTGTTVSSTGSDGVLQISFVTTEALFFDPAVAPTYFNPITGLYELTASIISSEIGSSGNVSAGTITQLDSNITGITSVTNTVATTGGTDIESNEALADRAKDKLAGNNVGTRKGIISRIEENSNVIDSIVVTPNDIEMIRDEFGGAVDVYVIGQDLVSTFDVFQYSSTGSQEFVLLHQPVASVDTVTGIAGGSPITFIEGTDYNFVKDPSELFGGSTSTEDKIVFDIGGTNPDDSTNITVTYNYDKLIEDLQSSIDADDGHIVTADVLVKEAVEVEVDVVADVTLFPGSVPASEISNIQTAVSEFIGGLGLGDSIDKSDIVAVIEGVDSVDAVDLNTLVLSKDGTPLTGTEQRLTVFKNEFPRANTVNVNVI